MEIIDEKNIEGLSPSKQKAIKVGVKLFNQISDLCNETKKRDARNIWR